MKMYLSGSMSMSFLPKPAKIFLDQVAENNAEFLLREKPGASCLMNTYLDEVGAKHKKALYFDVEFYLRDLSRLYEMSEGIWPGGRPKGIDLFEEADSCFFVWDGEDLLTFLDILIAISEREKLVYAFSPHAEEIKKLASYEDVYSLLKKESPLRLPRNEPLSESTWKSMIQRFLPSKEVAQNMLNYRKDDRSKRWLTEIIIGAPVSLFEKIRGS